MSNIKKPEFIMPEKGLKLKILSSYFGSSGEFNMESISGAIAIFEIADKIQNNLSYHFARYGLTQARFVVLLTMFTGKNSKWSPVELANFINVKPPTMTGILDGLVKEEYVMRKSDETDRRKIIVHLTTKGKNKIKKILPDHFNRISASFQNFSSKEMKSQLEKLINEVNASLQILTTGEKKL